jgi:hypothetical protein
MLSACGLVVCSERHAMAVDVTPLVRVGVLELGRRRGVCLPRSGVARRLGPEPILRVGGPRCGAMGAASGPAAAEGLRPLLEGARLREEPDQARALLDRPIQQLGELVPGLALECEARALGKDALRLVDGDISTKSLSVRFEAEAARRTTSSTVGVTRMFQRGAAASDTSRNLHSGSVCYPSSSSTPSLLSLRKEWPPAPEGINARAATAATRHGLLRLGHQAA